MLARISRSESFSMSSCCMLATVVLAQVSSRRANPDQDAFSELDDLTYADATPGADVQFMPVLGPVWCKHAGNRAVSPAAQIQVTSYGKQAEYARLCQNGKANPAGWQRVCIRSAGLGQMPHAARTCRPCRHTEERAEMLC